MEAIIMLDKFSFPVELEEKVVCEADAKGKTWTFPAILIHSGWSENDRYYSEQVLRKSVPLFTKVGSFSGHSKAPTPSEYVGFFEDCCYDSAKAAVTGKFILWDEKTASVAQNAPWLLGLSINAAGRLEKGRAEGRDGYIVESIDQILSVDCVTNAAAGGQIVMESVGSQPPDQTLLDRLAKALDEHTHRPWKPTDSADWLAKRIAKNRRKNEARK
jgi:hypothetical protein